MFANKPELLPESYTRYLVNAIRDEFDLPGTPLRFVFRRGKNPYASRRRTKPKEARKRRRQGRPSITKM